MRRCTVQRGKSIFLMLLCEISVRLWFIVDWAREYFSYLKLLWVWILPILARFAQSPELPSKPRLLSFHIVSSCKHAFIESSMPAIDFTARCVALDIMLNAVAVMKYKSINAPRAQARSLAITSAPRTTLSIHQVPRTIIPTVLRP